MMAAIRNFDFQGCLVRTVYLDGVQWFIGIDVCRALDLAKPENALARLEDDEKYTLTEGVIQDGRGRKASIVISLPGLFNLIHASRKPIAREFKRWVNHEVLPQIYHTGRYVGEVTTEEPEEGVPFFNPRNLHAPLGARAAEVVNIGRKWGPHAELAARRLYGLGDFSGFVKVTATANGRECLAHMLNAVIDDGLTVRDHIQAAYAEGDERRFALWRNGIRASLEPPGIWVATNRLLVAAIFDGSPWAGGRHAKALRPLAAPGIDKNQKFPDRLQSATIFLPVGLLRP